MTIKAIKRYAPNLYEITRLFVFDLRNTVNNLILRSRYGSRSKKILDLRGAAQNEVVYIIATGPSIKTIDPKRFNGCSIIAVNAGIQLLDQFIPNFACHLIIDTNRLLEIGKRTHNRINYYVRSLTTPIRLSALKAVFGDILSDNHIYLKPALKWQRGKLIPVLDRDARVGGFSDQLEECFYDTGNTVVFCAIQLAAYMKAKEIVLCGVDMDFGSSAAENYGVHIQGMHVADPRDMASKMPYTQACFTAYVEALNSRDIKLTRMTKHGRLDMLPVHEPQF